MFDIHNVVVFLYFIMRVVFLFCFLQLKVFLLTVNHNNDDAAAVSDIVVGFVAGGRGANVVDVVFDVAVLFFTLFSYYSCCC